jgi:hypothetical protein
VAISFPWPRFTEVVPAVFGLPGYFGDQVGGQGLGVRAERHRGHGGPQPWGLGRDLAGQESDAVLAAHLEAESRRGRDYVRVTMAMTVLAPDIAQALTTAWWTFRKAVGNDTEGWDMASATAEVRPEGL